jgi:RNA polymerase sigma-70 factor, ECF subfamily
MGEPVRTPDSTRLGRLFDEHAEHVWRVLRRFGVAEADVEDVVQEVFLVAHGRLPEGLEGRGVRTWLYAVARRCAAGYRRKAHRKREVPMATPPEANGAVGGVGPLDARRALDLVDAVLADLSEEHRAVYVLYEIEELSMAEVAEAVSCPLKTAYSRLYAARSAVREALAGYQEGAS